MPAEDADGLELRSRPADRTPVVEVQGLTKRYGRFSAVDGIDFTVGQGEIFGFLGPNGAGKSTTIKMLCTLARPNSGIARIAGFDVARQPREVRRRIGLVFQDQTLDEQLTAEENLRFHAVLYGVPRAEIDTRITRLLEMVNLSDRRDQTVQRFSGGMARRLEIARGLMHTPQVLFLDEPTVGLDPQTRARIWEDIRRLRDEEGVTVFLTTHYMDEAEYADRIAIIDAGRIVACASPAELKGAVGQDVVLLESADNEAVALALQAVGAQARVDEQGVHVSVTDGESAIPRIMDYVQVPVCAVRLRRPSLDDVFLHFTGHQIRAGDAAAGNASIARFFASRQRR